MICIKHTGEIVIDYLGMEELTEKYSALFLLSLPRLSGHLWGGLCLRTQSFYSLRPYRTNFIDLLELTPKKDVLFFTGDWNAKVGSQETSGVTVKFGLGVQNKAGQRLIEFCQRMNWSQQTPTSNNTREDSTHGHHQMVNTEIRLIIFFAAKDGEALYSQQKQDWELTMAQIMNSLLPNSDVN